MPTRRAAAMALPVARFRIDFAAHSSVGPGKIGLLDAVRDAGALSKGARNVGMSYRRAWQLVESLNESFRQPVTVASHGGRAGGGMLVIRFGDPLVRNFRELEKDFASLAQRRPHPIVAAAACRSRSGSRLSVRGKLE
jgi:molybdate transport system regulatory protein